jgi:hypothetical protein
MEEGHAGGLTPAEEAHHLDIHQHHLVEVQHGPGAVALQLCLQCFKMLRLHVADQPECSVGFCRKFSFEVICGMISPYEQRRCMRESDNGDQF